MFKYGTMDLSNRPGIWTANGPATVLSMSFQDEDGKETIIPTVSRNGLLMSEDEAIDEYRRTGDHLGKYNTVKEAEDAAQQIHLNEEKRIKEMAKTTKNPDKIFNDMVQQEMANGGRSLNQQMAINRGREQYTPNPNGGRSQAMQDAIARGRALRAPAPAPEYDHPQFADDMRDFRNDTMYNFARDNGMAGNGQGFSSRDYLNAVDMFDKYMKGETNDTSWSDFFDKHGLKPISRSNLEKRYRASWDSDAGKGGGPVPTGEQQAIMQQVAQAQQPQVAQQAVATREVVPQGSAVVNGGGRDDADWREGGYIRPDENQDVNYGLDYASNYSAPSNTNAPHSNSVPLGIRFNHDDGTNTEFVGGYWNPASDGREASLSIVMPQRDYGSVSNDIVQGISENSDGGLLGRIRNIYSGTKFDRNK